MAKDPYKYFRIEARELIDDLSRSALAANREPTNRQVTSVMMRLAHTLKGAARVVKQPEIARAAHQLEDVIEPFHTSGDPIDSNAVVEMFSLLDECTRLVVALDALPASEPPATPAPQAASTPASAVATPRPAASERSPAPAPTSGPADDAKAASAAMESGGGSLATEAAASSSLAERHEADLTTALAPATSSAGASLLDEPLATVRLTIADLDELMFGLADASVQLESLQSPLSGLDALSQRVGQLADGARGKVAAERESFDEIRDELRRLKGEFDAGLERTRRCLTIAWEQADALRLQPARAIFDGLERAALDAARALQKRVAFETFGGDQGLDSHLLATLRGAIIQVLRNSLAHGIESEVERVAAGKPTQGRITLRVERRGSRVAFVLADDGRGLNLDAIVRAAVQRKAVSPAEAEKLSPSEAAQLVFLSGVSTSSGVSELAGRGIGLDLVRDAVRQLKGDIEIQSQPGVGTTVAISVPVSIQAMPVIVAHAAGQRVLIPFFAIERALRFSPDALAYEDERVWLVIDDRKVPYRELSDFLTPAAPPDRRNRPSLALVIHGGGLDAAVAVDRVEAMQSMVIRPLPATCGPVPLAAGASLDVDGTPLLAIDPITLASAVRTNKFHVVTETPPPFLPILVVDDSLTTRMLEQSILEAAGYQVETAASGEEALLKAARTRYAMFIVDVEMPGINGFQLLERIRDDAALRGPPAIMVTSLNSAEDRRRAERAGARAFFVKSEFDETQLLNTIRRLLAEKTT